MIYYVETNIIAIVIAILMYLQGRNGTSKRETSRIIFDLMLNTLILYCISDICAYCCKGNTALGVQISNVIYIGLMGIGTYLWFLYVLVKLGYVNNLRKTILVTSIPIVLLVISILFNPVTNYYFSVDESCLYHRGPGIPITWIVEWGYMFVALYLNIREIRRERSSFKKSEYRGYLYFVIPMAVAAICQMLFYGTTVTQIGFTIALLMVNMNWQTLQVQKDSLTGLNNKNAFLSYKDYLITRNREEHITICMIDVDSFKGINDTYGHITGDRILKDIALVLKKSIERRDSSSLGLYRYGGDEFILVGLDVSESFMEEIIHTIHQNVELLNKENHKKNKEYTLSLSIGYASSKINSLASFNELIGLADIKMYESKKKKKAS